MNFPEFRRFVQPLFLICLFFIPQILSAQAEPQLISTFSIVARDEKSGELGVAVASRFFAVGSVVPWAKAELGAVATQSFANTSFGWRALELLEQGISAHDAGGILIKNDDDPTRRQLGIIGVTGPGYTYTGSDCIPWAGGRSGPDYAVQGNILAGEQVVIAMENAYLEKQGTLAERMYAALTAGDAAGGDSRGKQSASLLVVKKNAGYGGYTDRAIDIRVDDHPEPFNELGRLLNYALMNYSWNEAWTLFTRKQFSEALEPMERTAKIAPENPEVWYDLAVIRLAAGNKTTALEALQKAVTLNPKLKKQASGDEDMAGLKDEPLFEELTRQ